MRLLEYIGQHGYEQVVACHDPSVGLKAVIAIYDTRLGPAGGANNQLLSPEDGDCLHRRGILYAPDFVTSSGGVIALHHEVYGSFQPEFVPDLARRVGVIMDQVIHES